MKKILIIGGVAAGATAAARTRRLDGEAEITLLEAGDDVSFANCGLPYYIGGDIQNRSSLILASTETFRDQYQVSVHTATEAIKINREAKNVTALNKNTGEEVLYEYDSLILAQGGKPIVPPLPGVEQDNVFQLWTLDDMDAIDGFITRNNPETAVVVGGGFIGLEMVEALSKRGMQVSLVEMSPQIMPNLEGEMAGFLTKELQDYGVELYLGTALKSISGRKVKLSDGKELDAQMVLLSVGVRPTLKLAGESGLELGEAGGLLVNDRLQTCDESIFAAGDMLEIENSINSRKVRIPLAGPANRQGRIAAENALGGDRRYNGASGTSIVKIFDAVAGSAGFSLKQAKAAGFDADAVVVHKASHTAYYPGSEKVSLMMIFDKSNGRVLGAQVGGRKGIDKRIDVIATAIASGMTVSDLEELDLAYAPPFNSPNGPVHMASFTAENQRTGFSPSILAQDLEEFLNNKDVIALDLRDPIAFSRANLKGSVNLSQNILRERIKELPAGIPILLISDDGQKGHVSLRMLKAAGFDDVYNLSGGYVSLERYERAYPSKKLQIGLFPIENKSLEKLEAEESGETDAADNGGDGVADGRDDTGRLILDVRTAGEYEMGAFPGAVNIGLDEINDRAEDLGDKDREILVYCASGARSSYAMRILMQSGYTNVENVGSLHDMMARAGELEVAL